MTNSLDFNRLIYLSQRIKAGTASKQEKDEYMQILYLNGSITKSQYDAYKSGTNDTDEIFKAALIIGGAILVGYLLTKLFD